MTEGKPEIVTAQAVDAALADPSRRQLLRPARRLQPAEEAAAEAPTAAAPAAERRRPWSRKRRQSLWIRKQRPPEGEPAPLPKPYTKNPFFWLFVAIIIIALIWVLMRRKATKKDGLK